MAEASSVCVRGCGRPAPAPTALGRWRVGEVICTDEALTAAGWLRVPGKGWVCPTCAERE